MSFSDWAVPIVAVPKPNGQVRVCRDFRLTVKKVVVLEEYTLPKLEELFTQLSGCKVFSKLVMSRTHNRI